MKTVIKATVFALIFLACSSLTGCDSGATDEQINAKYSKRAIGVYKYNSEKDCRSIVQSFNDQSGMKVYIPKGFAKEYSHLGLDNGKIFEAMAGELNQKHSRYRNDYQIQVSKDAPPLVPDQFTVDGFKVSAFRDYSWDDNDIIHVAFERPLGNGLNFWSRGGFKGEDQLVQIVCAIKSNYIEMKAHSDLLK
jgi:hypothetical protein